MSQANKKTELIQIRVEPTLKNNVSNILDELGITTTQAVTMFFKQIERKNGMPFELNLEQIPMVSPDIEAEIAKGMDDIEKGRYITIDTKDDEALNKILGL
jgi:DNA-damage-inducible protein J